MGAGVGEGVGAGDGDADGAGVGDGAPGAAGEPPHPISIRQAAMYIFAMSRQTAVFVPILLLIGISPSHAQVVRTADATIRGLTEDDFPRINMYGAVRQVYLEIEGTLP